VHPDFSASAHDQTPGFGLRDVLVGAPAGAAGAATIAVTVSTQGRTIGYVPVVVKTIRHRSGSLSSRRRPSRAAS